MTDQLERDHVLPDGTTVHFRPIREDDKQRLLDMWERTSERSRRARFHGPFRLTESNVGRFTDLDPDREFALVATVGRGEREHIVGVSRYVRDDADPSHAEFAALVEDAHQGRGIGTALVRDVAEHALQQGVKRLSGEILAENTRMLHLVRDLGLDYDARREGDGGSSVVQADLDLEVTERYLQVVADDERRAAQAALERFFRPERVAVVGASRDPRSIGGLVFENLLDGRFEGVVYPINHQASYVQGVAAYPSLGACPEVPDLVIVCVPAPVVETIVDEAGELGCRAVCVISAGFSEAGEEGQRRQANLMETARGHGLRVVGPNCMGLMNAAADVRMNGTFSQTFPQPGRLAFSSQSGALGLAVLEHANQLGLGISTFISVGNKADVSGNDLLLFWEDDPDTDVILLYLESFGNPRKFSRIARRISRDKPIVAVKSGRTSAGARAASSHTAAMAAGDVAVDALFRQTGVIRTDTLQELFDVASLLSSQPLPRGKRVAILTNAGGPGILAADACESNGLEVPKLSEDTQAKLREFLPDEAGLGNPVDMIASASPDNYERAMSILGQAEEVDAVFVIFIPAGVTDTSEVTAALARGSRNLPDDTAVVSVFMSTRGLPGDLAEARVPSFSFPEDAARALGRVATYSDWRAQPLGAFVEPADIDSERARRVIEAALRTADTASSRKIGTPHTATVTRTARTEERSTWLTTAEATAVLEAYGVSLARSRVVSTPEEGAAAREELDGNVAVKVDAPIHKTDIGGVVLGLETPEDVAGAITTLARRLEEEGMEEHGGSFLVQEMVQDGVEMMVGVSHDPSFGPLVMVGHGGTLVELVRDVSVRVTPLTDRDVDEMLSALRTEPLLTGYRGSPPMDVDALKDLLFRINAMVEDLPEIRELDLNPVFVRRSGVAAVDVRMQVADA
ncbi:MAG: GNAT family N-acetyltransferase [Nitriliruptorales bacterium]|nr:GNAT family N-acetyltransferase [Nitriliruptorales bacterium]